jgi:hypothetical protein
MEKYFLFALLTLTFCACQSQQAQKADNSVENQINSATNLLLTNSSEEVIKEDNIVESFTNDSTIGIPRKNKVEIFNIIDSDFNKVKINFYSLTNDKEWKLKQTFTHEKDRLIGCNPKFEDFNADGLKDLTYSPALAARGANEIRRLYIYDKNKDEIILIKNSEDYPNLRYNKRLNSLTAQRFYGDTTVTDFLKIDGDELKEFASVETIGKDRTVYLVDKNGKETILQKYKLKEEEPFDRFSNYKPLEYEYLDNNL